MTPTNTSLIRRVSNPQDTASWAEFVELYEPLLLSYVRSRGLSHADAYDVVQEIFVTLLRALPSFSFDNQRARFRTWLYHLTMNAVVNQFRKAQSRGRAEAGWRQIANGAMTQAAATESDPEWEKSLRQRVLDFVLPKVKAQVQEKTWYCFEQRILKGRPGAEVAKELGITGNAVCVNAGRVLEKVRTLSADYLEEMDDD